ncbi:MAG TPA: sigma factor, partial [Myxococcota bacterium]|nr:sigma factor [Myxococcota bacterium]
MRQFDSSPTVDVTVLYRRFIVMVRARACRLLGDAAAAQQVAQEAFSKLLEHRERQGTGQDTAAFLYRTVTNLALNHLREGLRQKELSRLKAPR